MGSADAKLAAAVLKPAVEWVRGQIRKDRENRYSLIRDWTLPAVVCSFWPESLAGWQSPLFRISRLDKCAVSITIRAYQSTKEDNVCDGATFSPDNIPGIVPAALFHDPWYYTAPGDKQKQFEILAAEIGQPASVLRKFGDNLFYAIACAGGCPRIVAWMYYIGIRVGYPIVKPFLAALLAASLAVGCSGCVSPGDDGTFVDPGDYEPPTWEMVTP